MRLFRKRAQNAAACAMMCAALCMAGDNGRADVKIVTEIEITGFVASSGRLSEIVPRTLIAAHERRPPAPIRLRHIIRTGWREPKQTPAR